MKLINFGSLNIDYVYDMPHFVQGGETATAAARHIYAGGKGLNQSIAAARAGANVVHAGAIGPDGAFLEQLLKDAGADTSSLLHVREASGHALIQVIPDGQNAIIVYGGANQRLTEEYVRSVLRRAEPGDLVLLQNETSQTAQIITQAADLGLRVIFNPSPFPTHSEDLPLSRIDTFIVNEIEGALLAGMPKEQDSDVIFDALRRLYPKTQIILTLGSRGVVAWLDGQRYEQACFQVRALDTTGAGDTFCGYYLASRCQGKSPAQCLHAASAAAAIAITRPGAAPAIPTRDEVEDLLIQ